MALTCKRRKSKVQEAATAETNSLTDPERKYFLDVHDGWDDADQLLDNLLEFAGVEKVQEYNRNLEKVIQYSKLNPKKQGAISESWQQFTQGSARLEHMKKRCNLTDTDQDNIETLIRCAFLIRFPKDDASGLTDQAILAALASSATSVNKKNYGDEEIEWSTDIVQAGFNAEYKRYDLIVAPTLETLRRFAGEWWSNKFKAPYTSIIGPTMTGKTRLLIELAKHIPVVYVCLRPLGSTGQPPRSGLAREFLPLVGSKEDMKEHYCRLLTAILNTMSSFFSRNDIKHESWEDQLTAWFEHSFPVKTLKVEFDTDVRTRMKNFQSQTTSEECLRNAATKLNRIIQLRLIQSGRPDEQLKVLLAIDEARNLLEPKDAKEAIPYFRVLRRVLSIIPAQAGFFSVVTDTTSRVANFSPALDRDPSLRYHGSGCELFAPIFKISSIDLFVPEAPSSWDELLSPARLYSYGSPFYGLYFKEAIKRTSEDNVVQKLVMISQAKLLCKATLPSPCDLKDPQCFALLGSVIQTRLSSHSPINSELVSSHAAHCLFIDSSQEMIVSDYPPQFVYASAANKFLASDNACWIKCINVLVSAVQQGLVALGDAGEMATRIILIRAMQQTAQIPCSETNSTLIPHGYSVRLIDFLRTLSGKDPFDMSFGCINESDKEVLLKQGRIFFNHFSRIDYTPDATNLMEFLYRGLAVQCKRGQPGLDDLFTIYLEPTSKSEKLDPNNITFCGVQTKNQTGSVEWKSSCKWSKSYARIQDIQNPYLILLFSLRASPCVKVPKWTNPQDSSDTRRVSYQFLGLDQVDCLTPEISSALERLITAVPEDLLKLHVDYDQVTEKWVKQLSPVFYERSDQQPTSQTPVLLQQSSAAPQKLTKRSISSVKKKPTGDKKPRGP